MRLMFNLIIYFMQNLCFIPPEKTEISVVSGFPLCVEKLDSNGKTVLIEVIDPYEGLDPESFDLQNQLDAGVPLEHVPSVGASSLGGIDKNNAAAEKFVDFLKNEPKK